MPSAATKPDTKPQIEGESAIKQALSVLDKKVRNLEKRKTKLDSYRAKKPDDLNDDQREAIGHYEEVIVNLEFARDMQKQFIQINTDCDKVLKKQAKREKVEKFSAECRRVKEVLELQNILDNMGTDDAREDFKTGKNGALLLTEENLTQLDEWYQLISPSREGDSPFSDQCEAAADHLVSYLENKDKEVAGTKYSVLKSLVRQITDCGYFENQTKRGEDNAQDDDEDDDANEAEFTTPPGEEEDLELSDTQETTQQQQQQPTESTQEPSTEQTTTSQSSQQVAQDYYTQQAQEQEPRTKNIAEIVSSTGSFNFLQDSQIEDAPHVDPAVVAAQPMVPGMVHNTDLQFTALAGDQTQVQPAFAPQSQQMTDPYGTQTFTGQAYMAQPSSVQYEHMAQSKAKTDMSAEVPPPIPYPSDTHLTSQSYVSAVEGQMTADQNQGDMDKPFHTLNPNAPTFSYDQTSPRDGKSEKTDDLQFGDQQTEGSDGFQSQNFQGRRGGQRGGRGGRGMNNGGGNYRGGSRGGNYGNRSNYSGSGGNSSSYSGFPARNNYQSEGGFQGNYGSNRGGSGGGGFKRGGGAREGGFNRGAGSRGGAPRGGGRGGNRGNFSNRNGGFNSNQPITT